MFSVTAPTALLTNCIGVFPANVLLAHKANETALSILVSVAKATSLSF